MVMEKLKALKMVKAAASGRLARLLLFAFLGLCSPASVLGPLSAHAEVPIKFTYQGNLRQSGFLVNGQRAMIFRVYGSSVSNVELCPSLEHNVNISTGVFRVTLEPEITDWHSGSMWLELEVEGNRMSPREELTPSPYAINSLMLSGKRYTTAASPPQSPAPGDLWYDSGTNTLTFWTGTNWESTVGTGAMPGRHADTHSGYGTDPILSLGAHTVTGDLILEGILNPSSNLQIGGGDYSVTFASSVIAGWYYGNGAGLSDLNASNITTGFISGDRIPEVIVSSHIVDGSILNNDLALGTVNKDKLNQSGCLTGQILQWDGTQWSCTAGPDTGGGIEVELDPLSIHNQDTLQPGTTFYVSSGTVNNLNVNASLKVMGTAVLRGAPGQQGLSVAATGNVGIGLPATAAARLEVKGVDTQAYSFAVSTGTAHQVVVSTSGAVGIGTENPAARLDVTGAANSGQYIAVFHSGTKLAAWLRNK
ncbi:MAG TPA: hypothetical protein DCL44_03335 [Elusimicrobia bacterium]|nr:hypothetical protein [Elusimicrobiota bacterium]